MPSVADIFSSVSLNLETGSFEVDAQKFAEAAGAKAGQSMSSAIGSKLKSGAGMLVGAGIFGGIGQVTMTQSFWHADASLIAPFDYASMIWALIISVIVFNTWPNSIMLFGTAIVIGAGLFVIYREHRLGIKRVRSNKAQTPTTPLS